jgi:hypothetical protein
LLCGNLKRSTLCFRSIQNFQDSKKFQYSLKLFIFVTVSFLKSMVRVDVDPRPPLRWCLVLKNLKRGKLALINFQQAVFSRYLNCYLLLKCLWKMQQNCLYAFKMCCEVIFCFHFNDESAFLNRPIFFLKNVISSPVISNRVHSNLNLDSIGKLSQSLFFNHVYYW